MGEGVETATPSAISNSQHPNSFIYEYRCFRKPAKDVVSPPTSRFPPQQPPKPVKQVVSPPTSTLAYDSHTHLRHASAITTVPVFERTATNPARLFELAGVGGASNGGGGHIGTINVAGTYPPLRYTLIPGNLRGYVEGVSDILGGVYAGRCELAGSQTYEWRS